MSTDGKGYLIPSPASPYELQCFRVYVPKHTWYIGAFWAAYEFFTSWQAWMRDPLHRGKQAAALWRVAFDKARSQFDPERNCEMNITDIRLDPNNPCMLQVAFDGNQTWVDKADLSKCGGGCGGDGVLRFNGENIQKFDPCSGEWENVGEPFNPATDTPIPPENVLPTDTGKCDGAANIAGYVNRIDGVIVDAMVTTENVLTSVLEAFIYITAMLPVTQWVSALSTGIYEVDQTIEGVWTGVQAIDIAADFQTIVYQNVRDDGTFDAAHHAALVSAIEANITSSSPTDYLSSRWAGLLILVNLLGPAGLSRANKAMNIVGADCSGETWQEIFEFATSNGGWARTLDAGAQYGQWVSGEGWKSQAVTNGTLQATQLEIYKTFQSSTITHVGVEFDANVGTFDTGSPIKAICDALACATNLQTDALSTGDEQVYIWDGSETIDTLNIALVTGETISPAALPGGDSVIRRIVVRGTGINPFS